MKIHAETVVESTTFNPVLTPDNPVAGGLADVLNCFVDWLEQDPSDQKNHLILLALGKESLKKARASNQSGKFDKKEIAAAAGLDPDQIDLGSWFRWTDLCKYWDARRDNFASFARARGIAHCPVLRRGATSGGRNMLAEHWLEIDELPAQELNDQRVNGSEGPEESRLQAAPIGNTISYEVTQPGEVACAWWFRPWLKNGSFLLNGWRKWSILGLILSVGFPALLTVVYGYVLVIKPTLINNQTIATLISLFILTYVMWRFLVRPLVHLLDDRIIHTDTVSAINEDSAQLEVMKDGDKRLIRLVRYTSACAICGATVSLSQGEPDFPRRLIGRCTESPREHIFSFDRVTRKGIPLR